MSSEHLEQVTFFSTLKYLEDRYPELKYIFAVPNGGFRHPLEAKRLVEEGVKKGVPDIICPFAHNGYIGLAIEMKYGRNKQSEEQVTYQTILEAAGWLYKVCYSGIEALITTSAYLGIPELTSALQ